MKRSWCWLLFLALMLAFVKMPAFAQQSESGTADQAESIDDLNLAIGALTNKVNSLTASGPTVAIHGFVQQDIINDTTQGLNETIGEAHIAKAGTVAGDNGWTQISERNSRVDFLAQDVVDGWTTKGYVEADFLGVNNTTNEYKFYSQPTLRLRDAYLQADKDGWEILAGQWWTLFGWNMDYVLATVTEAPVMATLYERIPQVRVQKTFGSSTGSQVQLDISAEKPDEDISQLPTIDFGVRLKLNDIQGRFCSSTAAGALQPLSIGLSERNADFVWHSGAGDSLNQNIWASAVAADILVPVLPASGKNDASLVLTSEWTVGAGDTLPFNGGGFGGLSGTGSDPGSPTYSSIDSATDTGAVGVVNGGLTPILINSGNAQLQFFLPPSIGTILTGGYGEMYSSNVQELGVSSSTFNDDANWFVNVMQDFTPQVRAGLEYAKFYTNYNLGGTPVDSRVQFSTWYRF